MGLFSTINAVIPASGTISPEVDLGQQTLVGIVMPATWTAASLTFQVSPDAGTTWVELYTYAGSELTLTVGASQFVAIDPTQWKGVYSLKVRSGTAASPVTQTAQATLGFVTKTLLA